jgi:hypothetical protein
MGTVTRLAAYFVFHGLKIILSMCSQIPSIFVAASEVDIHFACL